MGDKETQRNIHYSDLTGHRLRGTHNDVVVRLGGQMPESQPGYLGIDSPNSRRIRRSMRRITESGRK